MSPARSRNAPGKPEGADGASEPSRDPIPLQEYDRKRDFSVTAEPPGIPRFDRAGPLTFVVQKHAARRLHYDVRLEWDGTMPSWAVPKGPSTDPKDKHLAVHVEDHPLDYASFEGMIPKGEYGGGHVIVWDAGTYSPDDQGVLSFHDRAEAEARMRADLAAGKLSIRFRGRKLKGSYALVRTAKVENGKEQWLMLKHRDQAADPTRDITADARSVRSGLTVEELQRGVLPDPARHVTPVQIAELPGVRLGRFPEVLEPMQAELRDAPFRDARWLFEPKLDGMRTLALLNAGQVELRSRRGLEATQRYPGVAKAVGVQPAHTLILDGEVVALDERGVPSFELLQERMHLTGDSEIARMEARVPVIYYVFDLLYLDGFDLRGVPLEDRLDLLARVVMPTPQLRLVEQFPVDGETAYEAAVSLGLEGLIAKRRDSVYEAGKRSKSWLKLKARLSDEFVVGGWSPGEGGRSHSFGALLIGSYDDAGELHYATHVGSGFTDKVLAELTTRLETLRTSERPFAEAPPKDGHGTPTWVRPELVVEVAFAQRTRDGRLRAPVFMRLREDKAPSEVHQGEALTAPTEAEALVPAPKARARASKAASATAPVVPAALALQAEVASVLAQLDTPRKQLSLAVSGYEVKLTNLDKELWPATPTSEAYTKRDLLVYYASVAPWLLPHLRDRPLTMTRFPNGITGSSFYQKHVDITPPFVETIELHSDTNVGDQTYVLVNNLATLLWLGQLADIALHTSLARIDPEPDGRHLPRLYTGSKENVEASLLNYPDFLLFDLDPYTYAGTEQAGEEPELNRQAWDQAVRVARGLKALLDSASLASYVKTSGATGIHVYVPVLRQYNYADIRGLCGTFAEHLKQTHGNDVTTEWVTQKRVGKVFLDHNQNARFKNLAAPYSPRAKPGGPVSMPLRWEELGEVYPTDFTMRNALARIERIGDVWADILSAKHDLQALLG